jgi:hypothetical protein
LNDAPLAAGTYTLEFFPVWGANDVHDYSIVIDSAKDIAITDASGAISRPTKHDISNKALKPEVAQVAKPPKPALPSVTQTGAAYALTGNLDADMKGIRPSQSLPISNSNNVYLYGKASGQVGNKMEGIYLLGTLKEDGTYKATQSFVTKPGHSFIFTQGNDKCTVTNDAASGDDTVTCIVL